VDQEHTYNRTGTICTDDILRCDYMPIFESDISELVIGLVPLQGGDFARPVDGHAIAFDFFTEDELSNVLWDDEDIRVTSVFIERREVGGNKM
jgi:hypothetical protein